MVGEGERRVEIVVCEQHGLRYNAAEAGGCVRCRREAGGMAAGDSGPGKGPTSGAVPHQPASVLIQSLVAMAVIAATGTLFWTAHREVTAGLGGMFGLGVEDAAAEADGGLPFGDTAPAGYPPENGVAFGPAEQQRQIDEVLRQMQEDEEADAAVAAGGDPDDYADDYDEP